MQDQYYFLAFQFTEEESMWYFPLFWRSGILSVLKYKLKRLIKLKEYPH